VLDTLLPQDEPHATLHDADVRAIHVDYAIRQFVADIDVWVGDPDAPDEPGRERRRRGRLVIDGLKFWSMEPPAGRDLPMPSDHGLWLTAHGALSESPTEAGRMLARQIDADDVNLFLYFSHVNAFAYVAGKSASFEWLESRS
jgi:hypothetical protein